MSPTSSASDRGASPAPQSPPTSSTTTNPAKRNGGPHPLADTADPAPPPRQVLLVQDDPADRTYVDLLGGAGCAATGPAADDAAEVLRASDPAALLAVAPPGGAERLIARLRALADVRPRPVIVVADAADARLASAAAEAGASAFLVAPVTSAALGAALDVAARRFDELQSALHDRQMLQQALETRKLVERAKAIFMKRMKIDEPEAHRRLQRESQNRRIGLAELAKRIIESDEIMTA